MWPCSFCVRSVKLENMNFSEIALNLFVGLVLGSGLVSVLFYAVKRQILKEAAEEAQEMLKEAREQFEAEELERKERIQEIELEAWALVEDDHLVLETRCEDLELQVTHKKTLNEEKYKTS